MPITTTVDPASYTARIATQSSVASSASDGVLSPANPFRKGWMVTNDSTAVLYVLFDNSTPAPVSSTTKYSVQVGANGGYYEFPPAFVYTGIIKGIWALANGNARVTEFS